jgi:phosphoenolpyruvate synthase/pyruvate phosphate dikinase
MNKPITPNEVIELKQTILPKEVFEAFNQMIAAEWDGNMAVVKQNAVSEIIAEKMNISTSEVYSLGYLEIETIYQKYGWNVEYDKPAYYETYGATFTFSKRNCN